MLHKEFEHKGPFPFALVDGRLAILKADRTPSHMCTDLAKKAKLVDIVRPGLKYPINYYCVTHVKGKEEPKSWQEHSELRVVAISDGRDTRYYWFSKTTRATYIAHMPSRSFEDAWINLFKSVMLDDRPRTIQLYELMKHFFIEYFRTIKEEDDFNVTITGKWKGLLVNLDIERMPLQSPSSVLMDVNGKSNLVSLYTHPLVEILG